MPNYNVQYRSPSLIEYQQLWNTTTWTRFDNTTVSKALNNTLFALVVLYEKQVIGMGRIVGDGAMYFYLQDIIVHKKYRRQGVGRLIMTHLEEHLDKNATKNAYIGLMAASGTQEFYKGFGYRARPETGPGMYKIMP